MNSSSFPNHSTLIPIKRINRYVLFREIGRGAIGTVFYGHDPVIDREVAVKIFHHLPSALENKQRDQLFMNEARAAGRLSHPSIITIYDAASEGNRCFIAMEYLHGKDLRHYLDNRKAFDFVTIAHMFQRIAEGLDYAHREGVTHRDIKPANIFIQDNMRPKLLDFGIARALKRDNDPNAEDAATLFHNNILGTPNYMSPEQALARPVTNLTDIYSLGVVLYEMLTHQKPFQANTIDGLSQMIVHKQPKAPHEINPAIPITLSRIVLRAMSKQTNKRFQTAKEMANELKRFVVTEKKERRSERSKLTSLSNPVDNDAEHQHKRLFWLSCIAILLAAAVTANAFLSKIR